MTLFPGSWTAPQPKNYISGCVVRFYFIVFFVVVWFVSAFCHQPLSLLRFHSQPAMPTCFLFHQSQLLFSPSLHPFSVLSLLVLTCHVQLHFNFSLCSITSCKLMLQHQLVFFVCVFNKVLGLYELLVCRLHSWVCRTSPVTGDQHTDSQGNMTEDKNRSHFTTFISGSEKKKANRKKADLFKFCCFCVFNDHPPLKYQEKVIIVLPLLVCVCL